MYCCVSSARDRSGRDDVPNDRLPLSMGRWELIGQRLLVAEHGPTPTWRGEPPLVGPRRAEVDPV